MAINTAIKTDIAFKRLAGGKSITNPAFSPAGEPIASNVQTSADRLFGETIPTNPGISTLFDTASGGIVQLVEFDVVARGSCFCASRIGLRCFESLYPSLERAATKSVPYT